MVGAFTPVDTWYLSCVSVAVYFDESEKKASSAVTRLRRSDFRAVTYAFDFVLANLGIAIAARMPMITTTINSSIRVKPLRLRCITLLGGVVVLTGADRATTFEFSRRRLSQAQGLWQS